MIPIQAQTTCLWTLLSLEYPWRQHLAFLLVPLKKKKIKALSAGEAEAPCFAAAVAGVHVRAAGADYRKLLILHI